MAEMTYDRNKDKPVKAKPGKCDGCGQTKPIVMVSGWGDYCTECSDDLFKVWEARNKKDWSSRVRQTPMPPMVLGEDPLP